MIKWGGGGKFIFCAEWFIYYSVLLICIIWSAQFSLSFIFCGLCYDPWASMHILLMKKVLCFALCYKSHLNLSKCIICNGKFRDKVSQKSIFRLD